MSILADLSEADARTQALANTAARLYRQGRIDSATLHELISGLTLIRASVRFAARQAERQATANTP